MLSITNDWPNEEQCDTISPSMQNKLAIFNSPDKSNNGSLDHFANHGDNRMEQVSQLKMAIGNDDKNL